MQFVSVKRQRRDKSEFVTKFEGSIATITFIKKYISQIADKIFAALCFFNDHLKHKTLNKTAYKAPSASPRQLCAY